MDAGKLALIHLLLATNLVKFHNFNCIRIFEMGYRWVIKGKMPIIPNAEKAEIDGVFLKESSIPFTFLNWFQGISFQIMEGFGYANI